MMQDADIENIIQWVNHPKLNTIWSNCRQNETYFGVNFGVGLYGINSAQYSILQFLK